MDESDALPPPAEPKPASPVVKATLKADRAKRLASALRDNLRRRKAAGGPARTVKPSN